MSGGQFLRTDTFPRVSPLDQEGLFSPLVTSHAGQFPELNYLRGDLKLFLTGFLKSINFHVHATLLNQWVRNLISSAGKRNTRNCISVDAGYTRVSS